VTTRSDTSKEAKSSKEVKFSIPIEVRFVTYCVAAYVVFIIWGMTQEKLTSKSTVYTTSNNEVVKWEYPRALNCLMAFSAALIAFLYDRVFLQSKSVPLAVFYKPALTSAIASPLGYAALEYITYPLMILTKFCKPIPVMVIAVFGYGTRYPWYKYLSVLFLCGGICLFCVYQPPKAESSSSSKIEGDILIDLFGLLSFSVSSTVVGILLVFGNLALDGFTNNDQDAIFKEHKPSSFIMMQNVNIWQTLFLGSYLVAASLPLLPTALGGSASIETSELALSWNALQSCSEIQYDVFMFCICASIGQVLIFKIMEEFGSLTWVTIGITRKAMTIIISVIQNNHPFNIQMWSGVGMVFVGIGLDIVMKYVSKPAETKKKTE